MLSRRRGIVLITLIIRVVIIILLIIYVPRLYNWYVEQNTIKIIESNVESVEKEIKSELADKHPVIVWNEIDKLIQSLRIQNPITKQPQTKNGWSTPGEVIVSFDGVDTFTLQAIGPEEKLLPLKKVIKK